MSSNSVQATKRFSRWVRQKLFHTVIPEGYTPNHQYSPQDIFVTGYPKSGNNWFQTLVAGAVYGVLPEFIPMPVVKYVVPDVHTIRWYKRHSKVMFFKTHWLPRPEYRRVIYLLRDRRDAMVSYLHFRGALAGQELDFMEFLNDRKLVFPCKWHEHVEAWLANAQGRNDHCAIGGFESQRVEGTATRV